METASSINSTTIRRPPHGSDTDLFQKTGGHDYSLRSTGRVMAAATAAAAAASIPSNRSIRSSPSGPSCAIPDELRPPEASNSSHSGVGNTPCCPTPATRPRPRARVCVTNRRITKRRFSNLLIPTMLMMGSAATYFVIEWRVGALRSVLEDLVEDTSLLREHLLSLSDILNEQVQLVEDRVGASMKEDVGKQLWLRDNDKTGKADMALESAGAEVVSTNGTEPWPLTTAFFEATLRPNSRANGPRNMLQPGMSPGECWAFRGAKGEAVVRLVSAIHVTDVSIEHISEYVSPAGTISSAPKDFEIWGLQGIDGKAQLLGRFVYRAGGPNLQTFTLVHSSGIVDHVSFNVLSNHGHPDYTCVYRLRVHGKPAPCSEDEKADTSDKPY